MLDCLGFKGIWNRGVDAKQILGFLEQTKKYAEKLPTLALQAKFNPEQLVFSLAFISDTVAISARLAGYKPLSDLQRGYLVWQVCQAARDVVQHFASAKPPLPIRGSITFGEYIVSDTFLLGPAVDEAASFSETSQGAFVWLSPPAQRLHRLFVAQHFPTLAREVVALPLDKKIAMFDRLLLAFQEFSPTLTRAQVLKLTNWWTQLSIQQKEQVIPELARVTVSIVRNDLLLPDYPMQLKAGGVLRADVLNPLFGVELDKHDAVIGTLLSSFDESKLDVLLKKQNTQQLLVIGATTTRRAVEYATAEISSSAGRISAQLGVPLDL